MEEEKEGTNPELTTKQQVVFAAKTIAKIKKKIPISQQVPVFRILSTLLLNEVEALTEKISSL